MRQTRKEFLQALGLAAVSGLALPARCREAQTPASNPSVGPQSPRSEPAAAIPSYLRGYESLYRENPKAAAVEWHCNAKWGLFIHYALIRSLQPQCLISFKQGTGTEDFVAPEGLMHVKSGAIAEKAWAMNAGKRGDICANMQTAPPSWLYLVGCEHIDAEQALALLADAFAQKANLTLNTGPLPDGSIHPADVAALREAGARIRKQGYPAPALMDRAARKKMKIKKP